MSQRHSAAFDRAVRIELLRTKAAMQRQSIAIHARGLGHDADPRRQLTHWLSSGKAGPLGQGLGLMSRYPFLLSTFSTAFANRAGPSVKRGGNDWSGLVVCDASVG